MQLHTDNEIYFKFYLISDLEHKQIPLFENEHETSHFDYKSIYYRHVTLNSIKNCCLLL